jgi:pimeloyl-ACP methyl ester carboxylesterase
MMRNDGDGFTVQRVELSAGPVRYREVGSGPPLLFVHGWGVDGGLWTDTASRLAAEHRCIVPDLPFGSHREALAPDADLTPPGAARLVAELIATLDLDGVTVLANDSGGAVSQILVTEHPQRIARLALTNSDCLEVFPPATFKLMVRLLRIPGFMPLLANSLRLRAIQRSPLAYGQLSRRRIDDALLDSWVLPPLEDRGVRRDSRKFGAGMDRRHMLAAAERLPALEIPVLLAWGEHDRFFPIELAERLATLIPDSRLVRFHEGLTFLPLDEPDRLADEVAAFIAATEATAAPGPAQAA